MNSTTVLGQFARQCQRVCTRDFIVLSHNAIHTQDFTAGTNTQKHLKDTIFTDMLLFVILNVINARGAVHCNFITRSEATKPDYIIFGKIETENIIYCMSDNYSFKILLKVYT